MPFEFITSATVGVLGLKADSSLPKDQRSAVLAMAAMAGPENVEGSGDFEATKYVEPSSVMYWEFSDKGKDERQSWGGWMQAAPIDGARPYELEGKPDEDFKDRRDEIHWLQPKGGGKIPRGVDGIAVESTAHGQSHTMALAAMALVADHLSNSPPDYSTHVWDCRVGEDGVVELDPERHAGLHGPFRVRKWPMAFCTTGSSVDPESEEKAIPDEVAADEDERDSVVKPLEPENDDSRDGQDDETTAKKNSADRFAVLLNFSKSVGDNSGWGGAHFEKGEGVLSYEKGGFARPADGNDDHLLGTTGDGKVYQGAFDIRRGLFGGDDTLKSPAEFINEQWLPGSTGPFIRRVEWREDFNDFHTNACGRKVRGMKKWMSWDKFEQLPPVPQVPPVPPGREPPVPPFPPPGDGGGSPVTVPPQEGGPPANFWQPPKSLPNPTSPAVISPNEIQSPSGYAMTTPGSPEPQQNGVVAPDDIKAFEGAVSLEQTNGFSWFDFLNQPVVAHEFNLPVQKNEAPVPGALTMADKWPTEKTHDAYITRDEDGVINSYQMATGEGDIVTSPPEFTRELGYAANKDDWPAAYLFSNTGRMILAGKNDAGVEVDGRFGLGLRALTQRGAASGFDFRLAYDGDGGNDLPDTVFTPKDENGDDDLSNTAALNIRAKLKATGFTYPNIDDGETVGHVVTAMGGGVLALQPGGGGMSHIFDEGYELITGSTVTIALTDDRKVISIGPSASLDVDLSTVDTAADPGFAFVIYKNASNTNSITITGASSMVYPPPSGNVFNNPGGAVLVVKREDDIWHVIPLTELDATLRALRDNDWVANAMPVGTGTDTMTQLAIGANKFPARSSSGNVAAKDITDFGLSILADANAAAVMTTLGLSANGQSLVTAANYAAMRALLDLEAGTDFYSVAGADAQFAIKARAINTPSAGGLSGGGDLSADRSIVLDLSTLDLMSGTPDSGADLMAVFSDDEGRTVAVTPDTFYSNYPPPQGDFYPAALGYTGWGR